MLSFFVFLRMVRACWPNCNSSFTWLNQHTTPHVSHANVSCNETVKDERIYHSVDPQFQRVNKQT